MYLVVLQLYIYYTVGTIYSGAGHNDILWGITMLISRTLKNSVYLYAKVGTDFM